MLTLAIGLVVCNRTAVIGMYWCSIILAGFGGGGVAANALDIAPAYAGNSATQFPEHFLPTCLIIVVMW